MLKKFFYQSLPNKTTLLFAVTFTELTVYVSNYDGVMVLGSKFTEELKCIFGPSA